MDTENQNRKIFSVSELTSAIKRLLEDGFPLVWITGEISNFRMPASGHFYFSLKDAKAQIGAVMFRPQTLQLKYALEDGMNIVGLGRIGVYEPRGTYQIILEYLEPRGVGALQVAFEQLKSRLAAEGLFDERLKRPIPFLPRKICIITSPTGAAVQDIVTIAQRRFPNMPIEIIPVKVQGNGADRDIVAAIEMANHRGEAQALIVARGGGSFEDLQAFNSEMLARAIRGSSIPVISAVGHETDFTIADFVADLRAATPSAAAELVVPVKAQLAQACQELTLALTSTFQRHIRQLRQSLTDSGRRLIDPRKKVQDLRLRLDDLAQRLVQQGAHHRMRLLHERLSWRVNRLYVNSPTAQIEKYNEKLEVSRNNLLNHIIMNLKKNLHRFRELSAKLDALNPTAILERGFCIARTLPEEKIITDKNSVTYGQLIEIVFKNGTVNSRIEE